jgi:predicted GNAT family N-acyltransferase
LPILYELGFEAVSDEYIEDTIPLVEMLKSAE